jgi:uncharacterized protein (UPF0276 family)
MAKKVSLGIMEQAVMRQDAINSEEEAEIKKILDHVTHVEGKYLASLSLLKERVETIGGHKPLILHAQYPATGDDDILNMVNPSFRDLLGGDFTEILEMLQAEWYSFHLGFSCEQIKAAGQFDFATGLTETLPEDVVRQRIVDNVAWIKATYPRKGEVLLENLDYNPKNVSGAYEYVCDPAFIADILEVTGCLMLLDFGHANCSAQNLGFDDVMAFIDKLPLEKVKEVHMSGAGRKAGLAHDTHLLIHQKGQPEIGYLEAALKSGRMTNLAAVTLETFEELIPQLDLLREVLERTGHEIGSLWCACSREGRKNYDGCQHHRESCPGGPADRQRRGDTRARVGRRGRGSRP